MSQLSFQSLDESILHDLSVQSWRRGIVNFFAESIPFSFSSSNEYAELVIEIIQSFATRLNQSLNIVEFGAGNGVFAKKCIQKLTDKEFSFHYLVTENSPSLVADFDSISIVRHSNNVATKLVDIHNVQLEQPFHVGILTYLLDTFPVKTLELKEGQLFEWKVAVDVKNDAVLKFVQDGELVVWNKDAIESWLADPIEESMLPVLSRVHECLDIHWQAFECSALALDPTGILNDWLQKQSHDDHGFFNFSSSWWSLLDSLQQQVTDHFMLLFYDFAANSATQFSTCPESFGRFGVCYFYSIPFFLLQEYCDRANLQFIVSDFPNSDNQMGILTSLKSMAFKSEVVSFFNRTEPGQDVYNYTLKIQDSDSVDSCLALVREAKQRLTFDQQSDYVFLFSIAAKLYDLKCYDQVIYYTDFILFDYGYLSLNAIILKAKALRKNGFVQDALSLVDMGITYVPTYDLLYLEKVFIAQELNQMDVMKEALILYFQFAMVNPQWRLLDLLQSL
tara:strand:- start:16238 stop:17755 length:1518 start_codon:yes stop_codon:yes gene_type:complete